MVSCSRGRQIMSRKRAGMMPALPAVGGGKTTETWRVFVAIELPLEIRKRITEHVDLLRHEFFDVRASWNREANLHLSLKFLGNIPVANIGVLSNATAVAVRT